MRPTLVAQVRPGMLASGLVAALLLTACSTTTGQGGGGEADAATVTSSLPEMAPSAPGDVEDYRIAALDVLEVSVFQVADLSRTVQVSSSGQITMPLIGSVDAGGRTTRELETIIATKLGEKYLQSPQVSVLVKEYVSQKITVDGAVNKPGVFAMTGKTTLVQAIALAEGLNRVADAHGVVVLRTVGGKRQAAMFDLAAIRSGQAEDPVIVAGDTIVVDQSGSRAALRNLRESVGIFGLFVPFI
ncbi:MAG: polysaccharide biosynthesis/export family protein [Bauldia sp.]